MFTDLLKFAEDELKIDSNSSNYEEVLNLAAEKLYKLLSTKETENVYNLNKENEKFVDRNYERWLPGFQKLEMLRQVSIEAGITFQKQLLQYPIYNTDPLLGVLMRQHANASRITGVSIGIENFPGIGVEKFPPGRVG